MLDKDVLMLCVGGRGGGGGHGGGVCSPWDVTGDERIKEMLQGYSETHMLTARAGSISQRVSLSKISVIYTIQLFNHLFIYIY